MSKDFKSMLLTTSRASDNLKRISLDIFENRGTLLRNVSFSSIFFMPVCIMICWKTPRSRVHTSPGVNAEISEDKFDQIYNFKTFSVLNWGLF